MSADDPTDRGARPYGRRAFLGLVAGGISSLWWADDGFRAVGSILRPVTDALPTGVRAALPAPSTGWRIYSVNPPYPRFDPDRWRLRIDGLVDRPLSLTFAEFRSLPRIEETRDFHCVTGWSVPNVLWGGVRVSELLAAVGVRAEARAVSFTSLEVPYVDSLSLPEALGRDVMIADEMDGRPLTREHGAPARLVIPQMYGYKNVKWLTRMTLTAKQADGYWVQRGYDRDAWVGRSNDVVN